MSAARLRSIHRYPVKGFSGQNLPEASLVAGRGIPFDRFLGIANGSVAIPQAGWSPCQAFVRMTCNEGLPLFVIAFEGTSSSLSLTSPVGGTVTIDLADPDSIAAANARFATWFPTKAKGSPRLARRQDDLGWWDYEDASVSLINAETVASLSRKAGRHLDSLRFRGNLIVDGLPAWSEFGLVGRRIRIGTAEFDVLRPIDRCKATSMDPSTGLADINMPALLALGEGHMFVGVHLRVVASGLIGEGDTIADVGPTVGLARQGAANPAAPPPANWPRYAEIVARISESRSTASLWLRDPAAAIRAPLRPGQHLRVHLSVDAAEPRWRSYTVSGIADDLLRITVKAKNRPGAVSHEIDETLRVGDRVLISGPFGRFVLDEGSAAPLVLISAGIGITPMVAMLRHIDGHGPRDREVHLLHSAPTIADLALWGEVVGLSARLPRLSRRLFLTRSRPPCDVADVEVGRIDAVALRGLPLAEADIMLCGPQPFMDAMRDLALATGAPASAIRAERFASPVMMPPEHRVPRHDGPFKVSFPGSAADAFWTRGDGTLLDFSEQAGLALPSNCRAGVCGACRMVIEAGDVFHLSDPPFPLAPGEVLTCCAVPASDLVLAL